MATNFYYQITRVLHRNPDGSKATQAERKKILKLADKQLKELNVRKLELRNLGRKHIEKLVHHWQSQGLAVGTIKTRMTHLRWLSEKIGKPGLVPKSNLSLGIENRKYVTNQNKARHLSNAQLSKLNDLYLEASFRLQVAFGLRREESMKIQINLADRGDHLHLVKTKGARPRDIPIRNANQRELLDEVKKWVGEGSLIPKNAKYVTQMKRYERACIKMGLDRAHGLRHAYAHQRYFDLTGLYAPAAGGPSTKRLTGAYKQRDYEARMIISEELGHGREEVTAVYLGR
ncbi:phage integrase N-terminal domain-containing protein [Vibrio genomosp. F10]|uniref:Integrase n=1 Tax=Vibrio genomosp. F10 TaxID=723171 RepID=A0A1B9QX90_9VIBR|nr:phage integrase N-terminal domain-containing protein [Vibrio genomosp. F10]OCH74631.1 integrase [Vibrio genomosp. F10]